MATEEFGYEIKNRVANSKLKTFDLETLYPKEPTFQLDIKDWLLEELVLQENKFREHAKAHDWSKYKDANLCLHCSSEAIIPAWAYMLLTTYASEFTKLTIVGTLDTLNTLLFNEAISTLDVSSYKDAPVIVKGCSNKPVPQNAYVLLIQKLQPVVKSLMFGEACSSVPLYKK
jgi:hypothetical protein